MCGISGIYRRTPSAPAPDRDELARIHAALAPRGPDGEGVWASPDGRLLLAHRRLSILDLSPAGAQPMSSADGRFTIVFNGEIYNFRDLAAELAGQGVPLRSRSDTEVLLELWRREGLRALARLRGMFALAIWDGLTSELVLARDPYGIKPLYYSLEGGQLRFASQARALEAGGGLSLEVDPAAVAGLLSWGAVPEPLSLRKSIRALPAGHWAKVTGDGSFVLETVPRIALDPAPADAAAALAASVRAHLVSDVPVGIFLSAGLDSALVAALAVRGAGGQGEPLTALTLTWAEARGTVADEEPLARATAAALGLRHVVREIDGGEVRSLMPKILDAMDLPSIDGFNTWLVARLAREEGLKVALSGLGGDELFGGYSSFRDVPLWRSLATRLRRLPGLAAAWPGLARRLAPETPKLASVLRYGASFAGAYALRRAVFLPHEVDQLLERAGLGDPGVRPYDAPFDSWLQMREAVLGDPTHLLRDPWRTVHLLESSLYLRHQLLRDSDWAGMAHGVEIRTPLVDSWLRAEMGSLNFEPARSKGKAAVVKEAAPELPEEVFSRPKSGFQMPIADWLENDAKRRRPSRVGAQSRRLALLVLEAFGVAIRLNDSRELNLRENRRHDGR
ncbi:MAG: asparagine synthase (glutamine-hydrolyzing) [Thermoanaerobaculia bacterium]|nr:asparagine synthase (glutamine-hydrolyzing) [Thermoanaerobaculia bacterium]